MNLRSIENIAQLFRLCLLTGGIAFFSLSANSAPRSRQNRDSIAAAVMSARYGDALKRAFPTKSVEAEMCLRSSDVCPYLREELFYIYKNKTNDSGFVIVSGDDRMPDVLAYSLDEKLDADHIPVPVRLWLESFYSGYRNENEQQSAIQNNDATPEGVAPLLGNLPWGQGKPFNRQCPYVFGNPCATGCVATAMAQVMRFHRYPRCGEGKINYTTRIHRLDIHMNLAEYPFQWDLMKDDYRDDYTTEEADAVATLMACCGASVHMDYTPDASGAYQNDMLSALVHYFGYDPDAALVPQEYLTTETRHRLLIAELNAGRPVNYSGISTSDGGHSFVIDGYQIPDFGNEPYYHLNWGWDGEYNGYYLLPDLNPSENGEAVLEYGFNKNQEALIGVRPDDGIVEASRMLYIDNLRIMQSPLITGQPTSIQIEKITNFGYRNFQGTLAVSLRDSSGNETVLPGTDIETLYYLNNVSDLHIPVTIPDTMASGVYNLTLKGFDTEGRSAILYPNDTLPIFIFTYKASNDSIQLCSSDIEVVDKNSSADIHLRAYELFNYSELPIIGYIYMKITKSDDDNRTAIIGDSVSIPYIEAKTLRSNPVMLTGSIPDTLPDGDYRLTLVYRNSKSSHFINVKLYDWVYPEIPPRDFYFPITKTDNTITIGNIVPPYNTTNVKTLSDETSKNDGYYTLQGIKIPVPPTNGIYIHKGRKILVR